MNMYKVKVKEPLECLSVPSGEMSLPSLSSIFRHCITVLYSFLLQIEIVGYFQTYFSRSLYKLALYYLEF